MCLALSTVLEALRSVANLYGDYLKNAGAYTNAIQIGTYSAILIPMLTDL